MILVIANTVNFGQLGHKPYIGWWSNKFKHCMYTYVRVCVCMYVCMYQLNVCVYP